MIFKEEEIGNIDAKSQKSYGVSRRDEESKHGLESGVIVPYSPKVKRKKKSLIILSN